MNIFSGIAIHVCQLMKTPYPYKVDEYAVELIDFILMKLKLLEMLLSTGSLGIEVILCLLFLFLLF